MKTTLLILIFVAGVFATPLNRREYEKLDTLLKSLLRREMTVKTVNHDHTNCQDSTFGVLGYTCTDFITNVFFGDSKEMCDSEYYKVHCCATCSGL